LFGQQVLRSIFFPDDEMMMMMMMMMCCAVQGYRVGHLLKAEIRLLKG